MRLLRRASVGALLARRGSRRLDAQVAAAHAHAAALDRITQYRVIHGYRRAFVHVGSGPALLLIHGIGNSLEAWASQIEDLSRDYTVIAPDLLGHGRSDKPRADYSVAAYANGMRDLISVLGVDRVTIVGHSLGGGVATQFAYQFPERCERLVLVSAGGVSRAVHPMLRALTAPGAEEALACLQLPGARVAAKVLFEALRLAGSDLSRDTADVMLMFDALRDGFSRKAFRRTLGAVVDLHGQVVTMLDRCYLTQGMPTLLVWGKRDAIIPYEHGLLAHAAMPGSKLVAFDEAGHFPHHNDPARFNQVLREFLSTTQPAPHASDQWRAILRSGGPTGMRRDLPRSWRPADALGTDRKTERAQAVG
jgi:pimeloyl-ACP methyl ester carboxylesterase